MVATNTASDLELCASTYRHFSPAGFSSEIFIVENNSRVIQKTNNKRIEKIKREDILRENFQIYGRSFHAQGVMRRFNSEALLIVKVTKIIRREIF